MTAPCTSLAYELLESGAPFFERLETMIANAAERLYLLTYILDEDETGRRVASLLRTAARRGVDVHVVLDGVGSGHLSKAFVADLRAAGIELRFFSPLHFELPFRMGRRLHLKLAVADGCEALVGGINIADRYRGTADAPPWLDFAIWLRGSPCGKLEELALDILNRRIFRPVTPRFRFRGPVVEILLNDFFRNRLAIRRSYLRMLRLAREEVIIFSAYFLPNLRLLRRIGAAAKRGVRVLLVVPRVSDALLYRAAVQYLYPYLLKRGVELYEYRPTVLHAKVAVRDGQWLTVGSYNLNDLSDLLSVELNIGLNDEPVATAFAERLKEIIEKDCVRVEAEPYLHAPWYKRMRWWLSYLGLIQALRILHYLTRREARNFLE